MAKIILIGCNKGGSGKTTTSVNLAVALAKINKVCLIDADRQRSASKWYERREDNKLDLSITMIEKLGNVSQTLKNLSSDYDYLVIDVAGRNSRELVTGATVADIVIAPHQCSQVDLDTLDELESQMIGIKDLNPELSVYSYHSMASTNTKVREVERSEFMEYSQDFKQFKPLESIGYYRKVYRDSMAFGKSVLEMSDSQAKTEVESLVKELEL